MLSIKKPRNARSKRALEKRQPATNEPVKTALFVNASHSSHTVSQALQQLSALKKPYAISFSKKKSNDVNPFVDASSIEFWCAKNDTPLMLVGDSRKKRKDNLTWIRLFDGKVLDMLEMGIDSLRTTEEFKPPTLPDLGTRPLFHFAGQQFATEAAGEYPAHAHLKSLMLDFYRGEEVLENGIPTGGKVALQGGLQMVISVTATSDNEGTSKGNGAAGATLADLYAAGQATSSNGAPSSSATPIDTSASGSRIAFRVYTITVPPKTPARAIPSNFTLNECGPSLDLTIRRRQPADATMLHQSLKRAKTQAEKNRQGKSDTYKKNIDTDEMGDMVGRVHVGKQDLSKLQTRKMKGLKADKNGAEESDEDDEEDEDDDEDEDEDEFMALGSGDEDELEDEEDDDEEDAAEMADLVGDSEDDDDEPAPAPKAAMSSKKRGRKA